MKKTEFLKELFFKRTNYEKCVGLPKNDEKRNVLDNATWERLAKDFIEYNHSSREWFVKYGDECGLFAEIRKEIMKRSELTKKQKTDKLAKITAYENKIGFNLLTILKALDNGFYIKLGERIERRSWCVALMGNGGFERGTYFWLSYRVNGYDYPDHYESVYFEDYGKTWALTKEELEK